MKNNLCVCVVLRQDFTSQAGFQLKVDYVAEGDLDLLVLLPPPLGQWITGVHHAGHLHLYWCPDHKGYLDKHDICVYKIYTNVHIGMYMLITILFISMC